MTSSYWFQGEAAPGPDVGDPIANSLRFRGGQNLKRTFGANGSGIKTVSFWIKKNTDSTSVTHLFTGGSLWSVELDTAAGDMDGVPNGIGIYDGTGHDMGTGSYRDPSAWYHVVATTESTSARIWVNGKLMYDAGRNQQLFNEITIGSYYDDTFWYEGYMADVYFIDGQALLPTAFGRYNREGVWVPVKPDFSMTTGGEKYSSYLTASNGDFITSPELAFNGIVDEASTGSGRCYTDIGADITWAPETPVPFTTSLEIFNTNQPAQQEIIWDGNTTNPTGGWVTVYSGSGEVSADKPLYINSIGAQRAELHAVRIDGELVNDPFIWSSDVYSFPGSQSILDNGVTATELESTDKVFDYPANYGFDGNDGAYFYPSVGLGWVWRLSTPITNVTKIEIRNGSGEKVWYNGIESSATGTDSRTTFYEGAAITLETLAGLYSPYNAGAGSGFGAIWINDVLYVDGVNGSYGPNGFHLDFADPNDLGADRSGNGNDFTASGFNTDPIGVFSANLVSSSGAWLGANTPDKLFDGSTTTFAQVSGVGETMTFTPTTPINYQSLHYNNFGATWELNGTTTGGTTGSSGWQTIDSNPGTLTTLQFLNTTPTGQAAVSAIAINGTAAANILTDNTGTDYDLMQDSPTQNYATLNPIDNNGLTTYSPVLLNANLASNTQTQSGLTGSTIHWSDENAEYYFEFTHVGSTPASTAPGLRTAEPGQPSSRTGANSFYYRADGRIVNGAALNAGGADLATGETWTTGDIVGTAYNPSNNRLRFFKNGAEQCDITISPSEPLQFGIYNDGVVGVTVNYGQQDGFRYQPGGTVALQTQNLPSVPIPDGGEHFRVLTGPGPSILDIAQGRVNGANGTGFQRGLWMIKSRGGADVTERYTNLIDWVRGPDVTLRSPLDSFAEAPYIAPTDGSVAWCWKSGDTIDTNNDGTIESQVSVNSKAGFSIISYTGNGTGGATIGHGLDKEPEFVIIRNRDDAGNSFRVWAKGHFGAGANYSMYLDMNSGWTVDSDSVQDVDDSTITLPSDALGTNKAGMAFICYAWHSVPGYSKVGQYLGNGDVNGPYIDCGFKPAFVMIKRTDAAGDWIISDGGRSSYNPINASLRPNQATAEETNYPIDFTASGFKYRWAGGDNNTAGSPIVFIAFAQSPFGGKKIAPSTAGFQGPIQYSGILPGIASSLRFRGAQHLASQTNLTASESTTFSMWFKPGKLGVDSIPLSQAGGGGVNQIVFNATGTITGDGTASQNCLTDSLYRDPNAWYHLLYTRGTNATRLFINGEETPYQTFITGAGVPITSPTLPLTIGTVNSANSLFYEGYMSDVYFIDGQQLEPTEFGQYTDDGVWHPKDVDISDYGTNGFHLVFDPAYLVGDTLRDQSGNGNDFTMSGFETNDFYSWEFDFMKDGPTNNYATLNPLVTYEGQIGEFGGNRATGERGADDGNLTLSGLSAPGGGQKMGLSTQAARGKVYLELTRGSVLNGGQGIALFVGNQPRQYQTYYGDTKFYTYMANGKVNQGNGSLNSTTEIAQYDTLSAGDVASIALDMDNGNAWFAKNGVWQQGDPEAGTDPTLTNLNADQDYAFLGISCGSTPDNPSINYGQQPFKYPVPVGYKSLNSQDLEAPITKGSDHFTPVLFPYTQQTISGLDFAPDLVWLKVRNNSWNWRLYDTVRGPLERLETNNTGTENGGGTDNDGVNSFTSDGFTHLGLGASGSDNYVAYCWKAGGAPVANNEGIPAQVSANTDAGFSIVTYTGNGGVGSVGHGLTKAPEFVIVKARTMERAWETYHVSVGASAAMFLNESAVTATSAGYWNNQAPTDTVIRLGGNPNEDGIDYVAYCWHSVPGFSAIGKFNGNSRAEGPFVDLGFRPAWIMFKATNNANPWQIIDTSRDTLNTGTSHVLQANADDQENTVLLDYVDIVSNGFKIRDPAGFNQSNWEITYVAFAENPLSISNAR